MIRAVRNLGLRTGAFLGAAILACTLAFAGSAAAAPLGQAATGTITGQVLSLDDVPLPNVHLAAFADAPGTPNRTQLGAFQSDAQGRYSVQVPAGTVWMEFETQDINGQSFWGYDNLPVNVAAGQTVSGQDFRVAIRVVSEQAPAVAPAATPAPEALQPGMPRTGSGPLVALVPVLLAVGLGMLMVPFGLAVRRRAPRR